MNLRDLLTSALIFLLVFAGLIFILSDAYDAATAWKYFACTVVGSILLGSFVAWVTRTRKPLESSGPGMVWVHVIEDTHLEDA